MHIQGQSIASVPVHFPGHCQEAGDRRKSRCAGNCEAVVHKASSVEKSVPIVPTKRIRMFHYSQDFQNFLKGLLIFLQPKQELDSECPVRALLFDSLRKDPVTVRYIH